MKIKKHLSILFFCSFCTILSSLLNVLTPCIKQTSNLTILPCNKLLYCTLTNNIQIENEKEVIKNKLTNFFTETYKERNNIVNSGNIDGLKKFFSLNSAGGRNCLENEICRMMYLRDWSSERGIIFSSIESFPTISSIKNEGDIFRIQLDEGYKFKYIYKNETVENIFGISLNHYIKIRKQNDSYVIITDYYLDCFSDALRGYYHDINNNVLPEPNPQIYKMSDMFCKKRELITPGKKWQYNRLKAVQYADRYCGIRWVNNNIQPRFNSKYTNFTGIGGNCTNYVSQCLGDKEGANLPKNKGWYAQKRLHNTYECSAPWVNADAFRNYIIYSGKGYLLRRASFSSLITTTTTLANNIFNKLNYGDIISYEKKGDIDHNAIVCEFDSHGYPMINSHTVERYHVPFDLGWGDKNITFHLLHLN